MGETELKLDFSKYTEAFEKMGEALKKVTISYDEAVSSTTSTLGDCWYKTSTTPEITFTTSDIDIAYGKERISLEDKIEDAIDNVYLSLVATKFADKETLKQLISDAIHEAFKEE